MKHALHYFTSGDGRLRRGVCFDIHDNLKDIAGNQGNIDSGTSAASSQYSAALSTTSGNLNASDNASIYDSGNVTINSTASDFGAIQAAMSLANSGLDAALEAFNQANKTVQDTVQSNEKLALQTQQGEVTGLAKALGWIAAGLFGIWALFKLLAFILGGRKEAKS